MKPPRRGFVVSEGRKANRGSPAWWQSGYAADCKSVHAGSIPTQASRFKAKPRHRWQ